MRRIQILSTLSALALGLGAITAAAAEKPVALIIAQGGLGDQSYNDLAYSGFKKALAEDKLEGKAVESKDVVSQAADILRRASDAGFRAHRRPRIFARRCASGCRQGLFRHGLRDPQSGPARRQCRLGPVPGAGRVVSRRRAGDDGRDGHVDQGHDRQAGHWRHRRDEVGRHRQIHCRLHPGRARHQSECGSQSRLFEQLRRSRGRTADGQGDVRRRRQRRLPGGRRDRAWRYSGGERRGAFRDRGRHRPGRHRARAPS